MALFDSEVLAPHPNFDDRPFWDACNRRQLCFQHCADCDTVRHPPSPVCPGCRSLAAAWKPTQGQGELFSYTVVHHASHESVQAQLPYVVALVVFDDVPGARLVTNITGIPPAQVRIGMKVRLWWDEIGPGRFIPRCEPAAAGGPDR